jgi:hypothetical protein
MILRLLCIWLVFYSLLSSLILSNLKHELFIVVIADARNYEPEMLDLF